MNDQTLSLQTGGHHLTLANYEKSLALLKSQITLFNQTYDPDGDKALAYDLLKRTNLNFKFVLDSSEDFLEQLEKTLEPEIAELEAQIKLKRETLQTGPPNKWLDNSRSLQESSDRLDYLKNEYQQVVEQIKDVQELINSQLIKPLGDKKDKGGIANFLSTLSHSLMHPLETLTHTFKSEIESEGRLLGSQMQKLSDAIKSQHNFLHTCSNRYKKSWESSKEALENTREKLLQDLESENLQPSELSQVMLAPLIDFEKIEKPTLEDYIRCKRGLAMLFPLGATVRQLKVSNFPNLAREILSAEKKALNFLSTSENAQKPYQFNLLFRNEIQSLITSERHSLTQIMQKRTAWQKRQFEQMTAAEKEWPEWQKRTMMAIFTLAQLNQSFQEFTQRLNRPQTQAPTVENDKSAAVLGTYLSDKFEALRNEKTLEQLTTLRFPELDLPSNLSYSNIQLANLSPEEIKAICNSYEEKVSLSLFYFTAIPLLLDPADMQSFPNKQYFTYHRSI